MSDEDRHEDGVPRLQNVAAHTLHVAAAWFVGVISGAFVGDLVTGGRGWLYSTDARYFLSLAQGAFTLSVAAAVLARRRSGCTWRRLALESVGAAVAVQVVSLVSTIASLAGPDLGPPLVAEPTGSPALAERYARQFLSAYLGFEPYAIIGATAFGLGLCARGRGGRWEGLALAAPLVGVPLLIDVFRTWPGMKPTDGPDRVFLIAAALTHVAATTTLLALANSRGPRS